MPRWFFNLLLAGACFLFALLFIALALPVAIGRAAIAVFDFAAASAANLRGELADIWQEFAR